MTTTAASAPILRATVDSSIYDHLAICPCGWRDYPRRSLIAAWTAAAAHERACHPDWPRRAAVRLAQLRHAERGANCETR